MLAIKFGNRPWLKDATVQDFTDHADYILGPEVAAYAVQGISGPIEISPEWHIVLSYEYQVRSKAMKLVKEGGKTLREALAEAQKDSHITELHFTRPLALEARTKGKRTYSQHENEWQEPPFKKEKRLF